MFLYRWLARHTKKRKSALPIDFSKAFIGLPSFEIVNGDAIQRTGSRWFHFRCDDGEAGAMSRRTVIDAVQGLVERSGAERLFPFGISH
jgi:hypothetical protein